MLGLLGGVQHITKAALAARSMLARFDFVVEREYTLAFGSSPLPGEEMDYALPMAAIPTDTLGNFTSCSS